MATCYCPRNIAPLEHCLRCGYTDVASEPTPRVVLPKSGRDTIPADLKAPHKAPKALVEALKATPKASPASEAKKAEKASPEKE